MLKYYGRTKELAEIYEVLDKNEQQNILIDGRRRIGKSFLIRKALEKYNYKKIIYQCKNISLETTIKQLTTIIQNVFNKNLYHFQT